MNRNISPMPHNDRSGGSSRLVDIDLEGRVIGAVLYNNNLFKDCASLDPTHFHDEAHREIWAALIRQIGARHKVTAATLAMDLPDRLLEQIGGRNFLADLAARGEAMAPTIIQAAARLRDHAIWRRIHRLSEELRQSSQQPGRAAEDVLSWLMRETESAIQSGRQTARSKTEVARAAIAEVLEDKEKFRTGINDLDVILQGGLAQPLLLGVLGRYGIGKTVMAGTISDNLNFNGIKHSFITLETRPEDIELRNIARRMKLNVSHIHDTDDPRNKMFRTNNDRYTDQVKDCTVFEHMPGATMDDIHRSIIRAVHQDQITGFVVDYWQLIQGKDRGESLEAHLFNVAKRLADICRREKLWGVLTGQADEHGRGVFCERGMQQNSTVCVLIDRDDNDAFANLKTLKSNISRCADTGNASVPGIKFDMAGPHFGNLKDEDYAQLQSEEHRGDNLSISE